MLLDVAADHLRRDLVPYRTSKIAIFPEFSAPQAPLDARELTKDGPGAQTLEPRDDLRDGVPWREGAKEMDMIQTHLHLFNVTGCKFSVAPMLRSSAQIEGNRIRRERCAKKNA